MAYDNLLEASKLMVDTMKHLTTLSVGAILIMVALLQTVFKAPHWKAVLTVAFVGFCLSNLAALRFMVFCVGHVARGGSDKSRNSIYVIAVGSFGIALVAFVTFVLRNVWA
jgi:hypothetical protein